LFLSSRRYDSECSSRIRISDPYLDFLPIPDPGVKKAQDPGFATLFVCDTSTGAKQRNFLPWRNRNVLRFRIRSRNRIWTGSNIKCDEKVKKNKKWEAIFPKNNFPTVLTGIGTGTATNHYGSTTLALGLTWRTIQLSFLASSRFSLRFCSSSSFRSLKLFNKRWGGIHKYILLELTLEIEPNLFTQTYQ
jgi:hypothetical protein